MKTKINTIIILGLLVAVTPWLGFPQKFKNFLFLLFGSLVFVLAYLIAKQSSFYHARAMKIDFNYGEQTDSMKTGEVSNDKDNGGLLNFYATKNRGQDKS